MNLPEDMPAGLYSVPSPQSFSREQQIVTTIVLLLGGYYALTFLDAWPSIIKRAVYEFAIRAIPSPFIHALQYVMIRMGRVSPGEDHLFKREDFGNFKKKEETLQRMLGQLPIPAAIQKARTLSGYDKLMQASKDVGPPGLGNWDNSCYQNSILQGLASLSAFQDYMYRSLQLCQKYEVEGKTTEALVSFLGRLSDVGQRCETIWTPGVLKSMNSWQQQDAQEYFSKISDAVDKEAIQYAKKIIKSLNKGLGSLQLPNTGVADRAFVAKKYSHAIKNLLETIVKSPLCGMQAQALECQTCGFSEGIFLTQFECLTLSLGLGGPCYLEELLDAYTDPELIEGVECDQCTRDAETAAREQITANTEAEEVNTGVEKGRPPVLRTKVKQITFGRLPQDLIIHINRSIYDEYGDQRKNTAFVQFPSRLAFQGRWCAPIDDDEDGVHAAYELKCIVTHSGRHDNGHYVAYGKRDKDWFCFNDEIVTKLTEDEVLRRGNVFMLFYEAIDLSELASVESNECFEDVEDNLSLTPTTGRVDAVTFAPMSEGASTSDFQTVATLPSSSEKADSLVVDETPSALVASNG